MDEETQGRDVGWAVADGENRPIREVLAERKANHNKQHRGVRESAFRERARRQALLASCLCCYPLHLADTESEHEEWCPSHGMHVSFKRVREADMERARAMGSPPNVTISHGGGYDPPKKPKGMRVKADQVPVTVVGDHLPYATPIDGSPPACIYPPDGKTAREIVENTATVQREDFHVTIAIQPQTEEQRAARELGPIAVSVGEVTREVVNLGDNPSREDLERHGFDADRAGYRADVAAFDDPDAAALVAEGDRGKIARAFLRCPATHPDHAIYLAALATKDPVTK